ncbi:MAG: ATP-dependent DNA helicase [Candidatus Altiarchaeota archaeon]|nr:ATP-dependent DNA helicase [Candidatus Altiarchaeota archaeon]
MTNTSLTEIDGLLNKFDSLKGLQEEKRRHLLDKVKKLLNQFEGDSHIILRGDLDKRDMQWLLDLKGRWTHYDGILELNPRYYLEGIEEKEIKSSHEEFKPKIGEIEDPRTPASKYFPYESFHKGQEEGINAIKSSASVGEVLLLNSPTGTGKTIMVLSGLLNIIAPDDKVVILTRTHSQYDSFIQEVRKINKVEGSPLKCGFLIGRKKACVVNVSKEVCRQGRDKSCKNLKNGLDIPCSRSLLGSREKKIRERQLGYDCPYYTNTYEYVPDGGLRPREDVYRLVDEHHKKPLNVDEFKEKCNELHFPACPYEVMILTLKNAKVLILHYQYFLDSGIRKIMYAKGRIGCSPDHTHLVIDEAHNIREHIIKQDIPQCSLDDIKDAKKFLKRAHKGKSEYNLSSLKKEVEGSIELLDEVIQSLTQWFNEYLTVKERQESKDDDIPFNTNELDKSIQIVYEKVEVFTLNKTTVSALEKVRQEVLSQFRKMANEGELPEFLDEPIICTVAKVLGDYMHLTDEEYIKSFKYEQKEQQTPIEPDISDYTMSLNVAEIDPRRKIKELRKNSKSMTLISGTLTPLAQFRKLLFYDDINVNTHDTPNPFPKENRKIMILTDVTSLSKKRKDPTNIKAIETTIEALAAVNGNVGVFFPSKNFLKVYRPYCEGVCSKNKKELVTQEKKFKESKNAMLIGYCRGRLSEGVDYSGEQMVAVAVIGLPLAPHSEIQKRIEEYYGKRGMPGEALTYHLPAIIAATQAIGRCIRSPTDEGVLVLGDYRYCEPRFKKLLPKWIHEEAIPKKSNEVKEIME